MVHLCQSPYLVLALLKVFWTNDRNRQITIPPRNLPIALILLTDGTAGLEALAPGEI